MKILIIEDDPIQRSTLKRALQKIQCRAVIEAVDGVSGLEKFKSNEDLDFIITDYQMPRIDGIQFVEHLRKHGSRIPVILLTGLESRAVRSQAMEAGAYATVQKPYSYHDLVATIETLISDFSHCDENTAHLVNAD